MEGSGSGRGLDGWVGACVRAGLGGGRHGTQGGWAPHARFSHRRLAGRPFGEAEAGCLLWVPLACGSPVTAGCQRLRACELF